MGKLAIRKTSLQYLVRCISVVAAAYIDLNDQDKITVIPVLNNNRGMSCYLISNSPIECFLHKKNNNSKQIVSEVTNIMYYINK